MSYLKTWLKNGRYAALVQSVMPAVLAVILALGHGEFNVWLALVAVLGVECAHLALNLSDDYFDYKSDMLADRINAVRKGFKAYTQKYPYLTDGTASVSDLKKAIALFSLVAIVCGIVVLIFRGWPVVVIAAVTAFLGVFYSAPPLKLGFHGMGELIIGAIFGPLLMTGVYFAACGEINPSVAWLSVPVGLLVVNILFTHSYIDNVGDGESEKLTLAGLLRTDKANLAMSALLNFLPSLLVVLAVAFGYLSWPYLFSLLILPRNIWLFWSLVKFARKEEIPLEKPAWYLGNMGNWEVYRKLKIDWFLIRWLTARNALSLFCLILIIVTLVLLFTA